MSNKSILITGGAGFIGSNFVPYFANKYPEYSIINLDKLTYAGNLENLEEVRNNENYVFIQGDICNRYLLDDLFKQYDIRGVINFAAESHVDNSITGSYPFIKTNIDGTYQLLETARNHWMDEPHKYKADYQDCRFHHISTDEVYGTLGKTGLFKETTAYAPNSPYSASKASSDFLVRSYHHTFGMDVTTSNCSNNYGPKQHEEKLIPIILKNALNAKPIPIYGNGQNIRDWLYVLDHCTGIDMVYHKGKSGETYNIGGRNEKTNLQVVNGICDILDEIRPRSNDEPHSNLITFVKDRPGHDQRYAIDATKIENELGWKAEENFDTGIRKTIEWYLRKWG
ncbi:MAG: dTDP-glucose 4,6-dehydratase [Alphaproteobacteria bacterium]|nr:dTDP-glucose 4,6-dehydratase [Alphaproteobacteria bacterium]